MSAFWAGATQCLIGFTELHRPIFIAWPCVFLHLVSVPNWNRFPPSEHDQPCPSQSLRFGICIPVAPLRDLVQMLNSFHPKDKTHLETLDK